MLFYLNQIYFWKCLTSYLYQNWYSGFFSPPPVRLGAVVRVASYSAISPASHQYNDIIFISITIYNLTERRDRVVRKQSHNTPMEAQGGSNV
jgi:hypothetical protein